MNRKEELLTGSVFRSMTLYALPLLLGNILQQAYNLADTWVVGRYAGMKALAGVGAAYALMIFLTSVLLGLSMGSGTVFSLHYGRQDEKALEKSLGASFHLLAAVTLVLTVLPIMLLEPILGWLQIPEEIRELTGTYLLIVFCGIPAVSVYNYFAAFLKSIGDSVRPLLFLSISTIMNIMLDLLFVAGFGWGAAGAARATVISQYTAGGFCAVYVLYAYGNVRSALSRPAYGRQTMQQILHYSVMTCLQQSVMNFGILMVQGKVNSFGTTVMAAFAAGVKVDTFAYLPAQEYANAFATFTAQNRGAGKFDRVKSGIRTAAATSLSYCLAASAAMYFLAEPLLRLFLGSAEPEVLAEGVRYLHIEGSCYIGIGCLFLLYALYRASGKPSMSLVLTVISLGTRVLLAYTMPELTGLGVTAIWWAIPIGWLLADLAGGGYWICAARNKRMGVS